MLAQAYFYLDFPHAVAAIVAFTAIGAATVGFIAILGPRTGLRTMVAPPLTPPPSALFELINAQVVSRYSVGYVGGSIFSILNILTQLGFATTAVILGGQTLNGISGKLPLVVGVILVGVCSLGQSARTRQYVR